MIINDLYTGLGGKKKLTDKQTIFYTRACNVLSAVVAILISLANVSIVAMNTFAFGIRCAGPFAAYGLGLAVPKATKNSGVVSIICGTVAFVVWQIVGGGGTWMFLMPVVAVWEMSVRLPTLMSTPSTGTRQNILSPFRVPVFRSVSLLGCVRWSMI